MAFPALFAIAVVLTAVTAVVVLKVFEMPLARWKLWPACAAILYAGVFVAAAPWAHALNRLLDFSPRVESHAVGVATWKVKTGHASDVRRTDGPGAGQIVRLGGEYRPGAAVTLVTKRGLFGWEWLPAR
jgi:hypothetical protein